MYIIMCSWRLLTFVAILSWPALFLLSPTPIYGPYGLVLYLAYIVRNTGFLLLLRLDGCRNKILRAQPSHRAARKVIMKRRRMHLATDSLALQ